MLAPISRRLLSKFFTALLYFPKNVSTSSTKALQPQDTFSFTKPIWSFDNFAIWEQSEIQAFDFSVVDPWNLMHIPQTFKILVKCFDRLLHDIQLDMKKKWNDFRSFHKRVSLNHFTPVAISSLTDQFFSQCWDLVLVSLRDRKHGNFA